MKAGDERGVVVTFPENYVEALAGKEATFKVTVKSVKEPELPELDDELLRHLDTTSWPRTSPTTRPSRSTATMSVRIWRKSLPNSRSLIMRPAS